jgi:hypothetical protein
MQHVIDVQRVHRTLGLRLVRDIGQLSERLVRRSERWELRRLGLDPEPVRRIDGHLLDLRVLRRVPDALPVWVVPDRRLPRWELPRARHRLVRRMGLVPGRLHRGRSMRGLDELRYVYVGAQLRLVRVHEHVRDRDEHGPFDGDLRQLGLVLGRLHVRQRPSGLQRAGGLLRLAELPHGLHVRHPLLCRSGRRLLDGRRLLRLHGLLWRNLSVQSGRTGLPRRR